MPAETITDFLAQQHRPQAEICGPWLRTGELSMLYAPKGAGKSLLAMSLAYAAAIGAPFLGWTSSRPFRVLLLEAEMPRRLTNRRLAQIEAAALESARPDFFRVWTRDDNGYMPNLGTLEGQRHLSQDIASAELILIDNLLTIAPPTDSRDDDVKIWYRIKPFIYWLRNADKTVLLIHHSGKSGQQMGTSLRENDMDVILRLSNPACPRDPNKLAMYLDFEKTRDLPPAQRQSLFVEYDNLDGVPTWFHRPAVEIRAEEIRKVAKRISNKQVIATMLSCPLWEVYEVLRQPATDATMLDPSHWWNDDKD